MSIANHGDDAHDLHNDLIARQSGNTVIEPLHRRLELPSRHGMEEVLMDVRRLLGKVVKVLTPAGGLCRSDWGGMT